MNRPRIISLIGRPGSGKGTQIDMIARDFSFAVINTGEMLRERAKKNDFIGDKIKDTLNSGGLIPTPLVFSLWMPKMAEFYKKNLPGIVFDGNPRKLYEAYMLEEVFEMFEWNNFSAFHIKITEEEAHKRLKKRRRSDDTEEEIKKRLEWFKEEVEPVIDYYKEKGVLIEIDGEQSIEKVKEDIKKEIEKER